jgi:Skp family chaperone for outer membrane proteins
MQVRMRLVVLTVGLALALFAGPAPADAAAACKTGARCDRTVASPAKTKAKAAPKAKRAPSAKTATTVKSATKTKATRAQPQKPTRASDLAHRERSDECTERGRSMTGQAWENFMVQCLTR